MASFFQPGFNDPAIEGCERSSRFEVLCNSILPADRRFAQWHQVLDVTVGVTAIVIPILLFLLYRVARPKHDAAARSKNARHARDVSRPVSEHQGPAPSFRATKTFRVLDDFTDLPISGDTQPYDLVVVPLRSQAAAPPSAGGLASSASSLRSSRSVPAKMSLARVDVDSFSDEDLTSPRLEATAARLHEAYMEQTLAGFAVRCSSYTEAAKVERLLEALHARKLPALLLCHHDFVGLDALSFFHASGLIMENACILRDGTRRDYFIARRLRDTMTRCTTEREDRPEFFVAFLDQWDVRPHPSVVKRAVKIAEHFGAVIEHGPSDAAMAASPVVASASRTIGGFEYLRRAEIIQLQTVWTAETRRVWVPRGHGKAAEASDVASLPLDDLSTVIPGTAELLQAKALPPALRRLQDEVAAFRAPPRYLDALVDGDEAMAAAAALFWDTDRDGAMLSSRGAFPLGSEPRPEHHDAVVETQVHLAKLRMLHTIEGVEEQALLASLKALAAHPSCDLGVHDLVKGLVSRDVRVFKGLATGFRCAEGEAHFWGVAKRRGDGEASVDIFLSQKAPQDASVVLHTWLAHCGRPRVERFEQELLLEQVVGLEDASGCGLPTSLRAAVDRATVAELLVLRQRLRSSRAATAHAPHALEEGLQRYCRSNLIADTTKTFWTNTCARKVLDRSMTMRDLIQLRLEHHTRQGATELPALDDLERLYDMVDEAVEKSLFYGRRELMNVVIKALLDCYAPTAEQGKAVDVNADLFALLFFSVLRRSAFEDVYLEATDRCPLFLSQPDQAAVFSELWILGSQCENYFGLPPRDIGVVIYDRYNRFLAGRPPMAVDRQNNEIMTMYSSTDTVPLPEAAATAATIEAAEEAQARLTPHEWMQVWKKRIAAASAMSIFCLPAIVDVLLLTLVGRGLFMTAFMQPDHVEAAGYALLTSLLLTAGVTGWVGSTGNYYLPHYAYDNMIYFHVQRLSGGFVLALLISIGGIIGFGLRESVGAGFVFAAYLLNVSTYLNLLGVMSTMHQNGSPLSSGRNTFLQTMPLLFLSPILSTFVNGHDLEIYLPVMYGFLFLSLYRYRRICYEWSTWMQHVPIFSAPEIEKWYATKMDPEDSDDEKAGGPKKSKAAEDAQAAFTAAVLAFTRHGKEAKKTDQASDPLVVRVARGLPYVDWLFKKAGQGGDVPPLFTTAWFTKLGDAIHQQRQLSRGLKDHNVMILFRMARYDLGQNLGLFLVALLDRWIMMVMSARRPYPSIYTDDRARYGFCFAIIYFCLGAMTLDTALYKYWGVRDKLSEEKLRDLEHAKRVAEEAERQRKAALGKAWVDIMGKLLVVFGFATLFMWLLVDSKETTILYYCYIFGYTCALIFQFNRCFTTNVRVHVTIIICSALVGFVLGCLLHALPQTAKFLYTDVLCQNLAGALAAAGTSLFTWKDWTAAPVLAASRGSGGRDAYDEPTVTFQRNMMASLDEQAAPTLFKGDLPASFTQATVNFEDGTGLAKKMHEVLQLTVAEPNETARDAPWSADLLETALEMWTSGRLTAAVLSRQHFSDAGLEDCHSLSYSDRGVLHVAVCFTGETERRLPSWQPLLASVVCEALLYHVAAAELRLPTAQAVQAEHMLHGTTALSKRFESELWPEHASSLLRLARKTKMNLMEHLCLDVDVDAQWEAMPPSVREAILDRIDGEPTVMSSELVLWAAAHNVYLQTADFHVALTLRLQAACRDRLDQMILLPSQDLVLAAQDAPAELYPVVIRRGKNHRGLVQTIWRGFVRVPALVVKWIAIISGAGSNMERELFYCLQNVRFRGPLLRVILLVLKACWLLKNLWVYWLIVYHRPTLVKLTRLAKKGARRKIVKNTIVVELTRAFQTGFASAGDDNDEGMSLAVYNGQLTEVPDKGVPLFTTKYDAKFRLVSRHDTGAGTATYHYDPASSARRPETKEHVHKDYHSVGYYDKHGRIVRGTVTVDGVDFAFQYFYKSSPKGSAAMLHARFRLAGTGDSLSIYWGTPVDRNDMTWVPSKFIGLIVKKIAGRTYTTEYDYSHRRDPVITTFLEEDDGRRTALTHTPALFANEAVLLALPKDHAFDSDDLLVYHSPLQIRQMLRCARNKRPSLLSRLNPLRWLGRWNVRVYKPVPTWRIRTELWGQWLKTNDLDAVTACWVDELVLREEPLLKAYWRARDSGRLEEALRVLDANVDQIVSAIDIETDVSEVTLLSIKTADLYVMGLGKDANPVTTRPQDCYSDTKDRISVIFNDIGCWPMAPGGVSNCRRDLVNGHSTIRNHVLAECANDYGVPRFQIEKNVQSLKLLPLWGLDGGTAHHGIIDDLLESEVDEKVDDTEVQRDIVETFIPLLTEFVRGARTKRLARPHLVRLSNAMLSMAKYYEHKDYTKTWKAPEVEQAWIAAWLMPYDDDANMAAPSECFDVARPSMFDFRQSLNIYLAYFFIFAVGVPQSCPRVFQSTHHGISSLFGMVLKYRRGVTFGIWDHAILWRECCLNISPAQSELPVSVQSMLLAGIGLATRLAYFHTDVVMPCASLFNPMWEAEIGTDGARLCSRNGFRRKIDPIVNGISNMDAYNPVDKIRTETPTVVMLSNVQMIKGVKAAIQAADIIINRFGFTDYKLVVYGAKDRQPAYALEMEKLIVDAKLANHVVLAGFGNSKEVLKDAWLFMNSSISEGLPLAIGEAALAGVPIVATEVGATALVLTDPEKTDQRYGEVVPPNDPLALARAQVSMLAMVGPWARFTDQAALPPAERAPVLPDEIAAADVEWLTRRFYARADDRRKLGLLSRQVVLHSFHGSRYLREHEQMYWIQWHLAQQRADPALRALPYTFGCMEPLRYAENDEVVAVLDDAVSERPPTIMLTPRRASRGDFDV
ncbi:hypothetical protein ACHAP9_000816 [Verticillium nonalfalfae]